MGKTTISIDRFASEIYAELTAYGETIVKGNRENVKRVAEDTAKELKRISPSDTGEYAKNWTYEMKSGWAGETSATVYNKKKGNITHLLENGHEIVPQGGKVDAIPHISRAEKHAKDEFVSLTEELI